MNVFTDFILYVHEWVGNADVRIFFLMCGAFILWTNTRPVMVGTQLMVRFVSQVGKDSLRTNTLHQFDRLEGLVGFPNDSFIHSSLLQVILWSTAVYLDTHWLERQSSHVNSIPTCCLKRRHQHVKVCLHSNQEHAFSKNNLMNSLLTQRQKNFEGVRLWDYVCTL